MSETGEEFAELPLDGVGTRLARAREAAGLTIGAVAAQTRIPERHLQMLEAGELGKLPGRTYAIGFGRSMARVVGLDEEEVVAQIRDEMSGAEYHSATGGRHLQQYESDDPGKVPSKKMAVMTALGALAVLLAVFFVWRSFLVPGDNLEPGTAVDGEVIAADGDDTATGAVANAGSLTGAEAGAAIAAAAAANAAIDPAGEVAFTSAEDGIWVKFYDGSGKQLMQKQMAKGERYVVPADAVNPMVWTGRADALAITVGGKPVAPIGSLNEIVKDAPVSAKALLARAEPVAAPALPGATGAAGGQAGPLPAVAPAPAPAPAVGGAAPAIN